MRILLKEGKVIEPCQKIEEKLDILIEGEFIKKISKNIPSKEADEVIDCKDKIITAGLIDSHCHLRHPKENFIENIKSLSKAAIKGGFTTVICMANTIPPVDNPQAIRHIKEIAKQQSDVRIEVVGAITKNLEGKELCEFGQMSEEGAVGFSDDGKAINNSLVMRQALEYAKLTGSLILSHPEDTYLAADGVMNESYLSYLVGMPSCSAEAESIAVSRDIRLTRLTNSKIHFLHISTKDSLEQIIQAKRMNIDVTCEVTPHHLFFTEDVILTSGFDANYKTNPPLRNKQDVDFLIENIDFIDIISTDHAPHLPSEKELGFLESPFGVVGLQTALAAILTKLYFEKNIPLLKIIEKLTKNPAERFSLKNRGILKEGYLADITIIDLNKKMKIKEDYFLDFKYKNSPFLNKELQGFAPIVIIGGKIFVNF